MLIRKLLPMPVFNAADATGGADGGGGDGGAAAAAAAAGGGDGGQGGGAEPWYTPFNLDEPAKQFIADRKFDRPDGLQSLLKSAIESDRVARSRNVFEKPDPARVNEWAGWSELGWKEKPEDYALKKPQTPQNFQYMQSFEDAIKKIAHENKVPLPAAQAMLDGLTAFAVSEIDATDARGAKAAQDLDVALRKDWGADYDRNVELARRAVRHFGVGLDDSSQLEAIIGAPSLTRLFHQIGAAMGEDKLVVSGGGGGLGESMEGLRAELRRLQGDKDFMTALGDERHARHADVAAQRKAIIDKIAAIELKQRR
ncbi:hypothetical protein [Bosea minatitlanensis]|uniref:Uncharacterized protein n=1 Tax=Bosea minatitlanensis TaxID=128782 RepID=A0ABW0EYZ8_9HYPH|nr:hypothetical protein [Bosea minatitlanensis]MCT4495394.1 hypothetical protein [Bosea minatitlanensis]